MANAIVLESLLELDEATLVEPGWLWGNILERQTLSVVHTGPKRGKSMFTMNLGLALAAGFPSFLDFGVAGPARVVIFQREVHRFGIRVRMQKMVEHAPFPLDRHDTLARIQHNVSRATRLHDMKTFRDFRLLLQDIRPDLVVLDPLAHVLVEDENDNAAVGRALERVEELRDDPGCAVMVVHHNRKENDITRGVDPTQNARGADRIIADADTIISLVRGRKDPRGPVSRFVVTARNSEGVEPFSAVFNKSTCWWERTFEKGDTMRIGEWVAAAGGMTKHALVETIEREWKLNDPTHHRSAQNYIAKAVEAGVLQEHRGVYVRGAGDGETKEEPERKL